MNIDELVRDAFEEAAAAAPDADSVLTALPARRRARQRRRLGVTAVAVLAVLAVAVPYTVLRPAATAGRATTAGNPPPVGPALHWDLGWLPPGSVETTRDVSPAVVAFETRTWQVGTDPGRTVELLYSSTTYRISGTPITVGGRTAWWLDDSLRIQVGPQRWVNVIVTGQPPTQTRPLVLRIAASLRPAHGLAVGPAPLRLSTLPPGFAVSHGLSVTGRSPDAWTAHLDAREPVQRRRDRIIAIRLHNTNDTDGIVQSWNHPYQQVQVAGRPARFYQLTQTNDWNHLVVLRTTLPGTHDDLVVLAYRNLARSLPTITRDELIQIAAGIRALPATYPWIHR